MYRLSYHATQRIKQRRLQAEWLLAALEGRLYVQPDGLHLLYDPSSRCALIVDPQSKVIITALRLKPAHAKRIFSARKGNKKWQSNGTKHPHP